MSEEKKTHPEPKYSVTFVTNVGKMNIFESFDMFSLADMLDNYCTMAFCATLMGTLKFSRIFLMFLPFFLHLIKKITVEMFKEYSQIQNTKQDCSYQGEALNVPTAF